MDLRHHSDKTGSPQQQEFPLLEHLNLQHTFNLSDEEVV